MAGNVYDFRSGRSIKNLSPQEVGEELERIRAEKGALTPAAVLEEATSEDSPLHSAFEWDDSEAAKQHRLNQARRLITSIRILNGPNGSPVTAMISVKTPGRGREYVPTLQAMNDDELKLRVLQDIRQFIEAQERRYAHISHVAEVLERLKKAVG